MAETIIADEQNEIDESNDTEETTESEDNDDTYVNALEAKLAKAEADKAKREARYKSTKKQESSRPVETKKEQNVDLDSIVEKKLYAIEEQREFIKTYGEETFNEVKKIKDQHPTLSLNDAYKISPIANEQARNENPESLSMGGRPNPNVYTDGKTITQEQLVKLDKLQYRLMKDKIAKGEVTLKQ